MLPANPAFPPLGQPLNPVERQVMFAARQMWQGCTKYCIALLQALARVNLLDFESKFASKWNSYPYLSIIPHRTPQKVVAFLFPHPLNAKSQ